MYDGRAALEMILAVYESHRLNAPVELPLKNRRHPLPTCLLSKTEKGAEQVSRIKEMEIDYFCLLFVQRV